MCVPTLWIYFILFSQHQTREAGFSSVANTVVCFLTAVNEGVYWSFIRFLWHVHTAGDAIFWAGVDWRRHLLSLKALLSDPQNRLVQLWPQLTSAFFSDFRWYKAKTICKLAMTGWHLDYCREKNQRYLSLIYFNAKTVYWVHKQYFSPPKILLWHLQYHLRYQISATTAAAVIQELFISLIVMYVCIWARWWLLKF